MTRKPFNVHHYEPEDFENYRRLLEMTHASEMPHKTGTENRPRSTAKWKFFQENGLVESEQTETEGEGGKGSGIQFLPGDIEGLIEQLQLLLAESRVGNKSLTRNQIVAILDQLIRRNYLRSRGV